MPLSSFNLCIFMISIKFSSHCHKTYGETIVSRNIVQCEHFLIKHWVFIERHNSPILRCNSEYIKSTLRLLDICRKLYTTRAYQRSIISIPEIVNQLVDFITNKFPFWLRNFLIRLVKLFSYIYLYIHNKFKYKRKHSNCQIRRKKRVRGTICPCPFFAIR